MSADRLHAKATEHWHTGTLDKQKICQNCGCSRLLRTTSMHTKMCQLRTEGYAGKGVESQDTQKLHTPLAVGATCCCMHVNSFTQARAAAGAAQPRRLVSSAKHDCCCCCTVTHRIRRPRSLTLRTSLISKDCNAQPQQTQRPH